MLDSEQVKQRVNIVELIRRTGGEAVKLKRGRDGEYMGLCPIHGDRNPSLSVSEKKGLFHCFGCNASGDVFDWVGELEGISAFQDRVKRVADLFGIGETQPAIPAQPKAVATYDYTDENGELLYQVVRYEPGENGAKKTFKQRRPDGRGGWVWGLGDVRRPLYRLPRVVQTDEVVWWVEGEKDVATLEGLGLIATTTSGGAKTGWRDEWAESLRGRRVAILPDNDTPGNERGREIYSKLLGVAARVVLLKPEQGKDATEWVSLGATAETLQQSLQDALKRKYGLLSPIEVVDRRYGLNAFLDPTLRPAGIKTGFDELDKATVGLHAGELILIGGRPAMGKTSFAMCIARNVAMSRKATAVFSLEMSSESLLDRMVCAEARVPFMDFRRGDLDSKQRTAIMQAHYELSQMPLRIDDTAGMSLQLMAKRLEIMRNEIGLSLVVVDYLQLMRVSKNENRNQEVSEISRGLKLLSKEFGIPVVALSQLNRASENNTASRPNMASLRDSGSLEQDADMIWFVHRPEVYKPDDLSAVGVAEIIISKQRNGPLGIKYLKFVKEFTLFKNREEYDAGTIPTLLD